MDYLFIYLFMGQKDRNPGALGMCPGGSRAPDGAQLHAAPALPDCSVAHRPFPFRGPMTMIARSHAPDGTASI